MQSKGAGSDSYNKWGTICTLQQQQPASDGVRIGRGSTSERSPEHVYDIFSLWAISTEKMVDMLPE